MNNLNYFAKVSNHYKKLPTYFETDLQIAYILCKDIINVICKDAFKISTIDNADIIKINSDKKLAPIDVILSIKKLSNILKDIFVYSDDDYINLKDSCRDSLEIVVSWYLYKYYNVDDYKIEIEKYYKDNDNDLKIADMNDLIKLGWDVNRYLSEGATLNYETIEDLTPEHDAVNDEYLKVISENPENRRVLLNRDNKMVGLWSFLQLYDEWFQKAKEGKLFDSELNTKMIPPLIAGTYNLYFVIIAHNVKYDKINAFRKLFFSLIKSIESFALEGIFFNEICTLAYSESGKALCKSIGLKYHTDHIDHGEIYCGNMKELLEKPLCKDFNLVKSLYKQNTKTSE
ncbi:MAG: hypothetical protein ABF289_16815 [Clostridiales bacterium]